MINAKIAEDVRCNLTKALGKGIWSKDLVERAILNVVNEKHIKLNPDDMEIISKMVLRFKCGDEFVEPEGEEKVSFNNDEDIFESLYENFPADENFDLYSIEDFQEEAEGLLERVIDALDSVDATNVSPDVEYVLGKIMKTRTKLEDILEKSNDLQQMVGSLRGLVSEINDTLYEATDN